jgi:hypothetical protein
MTRKVLLFVLVILGRLPGVMRRLNSGQVVRLLLQRAGQWVTLLLDGKKAKFRIRRRMVVVVTLVVVVLVAVVVVLAVVLLLLWTHHGNSLPNRRWCVVLRWGIIRRWSLFAKRETDVD